MTSPIRYLGIDLAWGEKQPTGVAVLDDEAHLLHLATVSTDDQIADELAAHLEGRCVVAFDAPLVVTNPTGSRAAEKELNHDFRAFEAGAHPTNTGKPEFANGPRAARLARRFGLDIDPRSGRDRRALEVFPHPATIVLFSLARTLKYKNKPGRTLESLRSELLTLMGHVESIVTVNDQWRHLRTLVESAARKSQLRVAEDQVDAVVCAYVGLFADRWPERTTVYGDLGQGYIVTPTLPDAAATVRAAIGEYAALRPELEIVGQSALDHVRAILDEAGINYLTVTGRTKTVPSFAQKAGRLIDGVPVYQDPLNEISDLIGVRVITYVRSDVDAVAELLSDQAVVHDDRDLGQETADEGRFGYSSRHLLIEFDPPANSAVEHLRGRPVQVQIRTVLQHAWAEFEHDIRYKGVVPDEHASEFDRRFTLAAGLLELADHEFTAIRDRLRGAGRSDSAEPDTDPRIAPRELAAFLAGQYADAGWSRTDHYAWISGLLLELGITSLDELADDLRSVDEARIAAAMDYRYPPGAVRRLDDALLAAHGARYLDLHGNAERRPALAARWDRLRSVNDG